MLAGAESQFRDDEGVLWGAEVPRIFTPPLRELTPDTSLGFEVIDFAEQVLMIHLFPWQRWFLIHALELLPDGSPRFRTIVLMIARQSGKTLIVQVLTLWAMFMRGALVGGVAQKEDVAKEIWRDALQMAQDREWLASEIGPVTTANGSVQFRLHNGGRYKISAGGRKAFRGMTIDGFAIIDELREQTDWGTWGAITSTTKATATGQVIAMSNAGDAWATEPKPTTAAVLPMAIKAPKAPSPAAREISRKKRRCTARATRQPASNARIRAACLSGLSSPVMTSTGRRPLE